MKPWTTSKKKELADHVRHFIAAYQALAIDADVMIRGGIAYGSDGGHAVIVIDLENEQYVFSTDQARLVADVAEKISEDHNCGSRDCTFTGFPALIDTLRRGANDMDDEFSARTLQ